MAAEQTQHAVTPAEYIAHHLGFNTQTVAEGGGFWRINVDTLFTSLFLGLLVIGLMPEKLMEICIYAISQSLGG